MSAQRPTLAEVLRAKGYGYERPPGMESGAGRDIYDLETGEVVLANASAGEVWRWLRGESMEVPPSHLGLWCRCGGGWTLGRRGFPKRCAYCGEPLSRATALGSTVTANSDGHRFDGGGEWYLVGANPAPALVAEPAAFRAFSGWVK